MRGRAAGSWRGAASPRLGASSVIVIGLVVAALVTGSSQAATSVVTTATLTPAPNAAGWLRSAVSVTLTASDSFATTWYAIDDAACTPAALPPYFHFCRSTNDDLRRPFTISEEGRHTVYFFSEDAAGNVEALQTLPVWIDTTPPQLHLPGGFSVDATGPSGALVSYAASASDDLDLSPSVLCDRAAGSLFPIGTTMVTCTARDAAGNSVSGSFTATVKGVAEQLSDIRVAVQGLNLTQGIANSLDAKLQNLEQAISSNKNGDRVSTCNKLDAFVNEINAQVQGGTLSQTQATPLIDAARRIKAVLGCA
jgi:hypothetical protein